MVCITVILILSASALLFMLRHKELFVNEPTEKETEILTEKETKKKESETETETERELFVPAPEIDEQYLTKNAWSRPGDKIKSLDYIVIHYLGNPNTSAQDNRDYFESLKNLRDTSMSANYIVGMEGEIIHCVPDDEVAYASNQANGYSLSIENCHPDTSGKFTEETYDSLVWLTAYLSEKYDIDRDHIIRHYDVTGKYCPKYFVYHPRRWQQFLDDVMTMRETCREEILQARRESEEAERQEQLRREQESREALTEDLLSETEDGETTDQPDNLPGETAVDSPENSPENEKNEDNGE